MNQGNEGRPGDRKLIRLGESLPSTCMAPSHEGFPKFYKSAVFVRD